MTLTTSTIEPHTLDGERTVLGALILDPNAIHKVIGTLTPADFFDPVYRSIYAAICELYAESTPIDFVVVSDKLKDDPKVEQIGGSGFIAELAVDVPTSSHIEHYSELVKQRSVRRQLMKVGKDIVGLAGEEKTSTSDLIAKAEEQLLSLHTGATERKAVALGKMSDDRYEHFTQLLTSEDRGAQLGIQTGFPDLDNLLIGLKPGNYMVIAGRPSMGKTAIALQMAQHMAEIQRKKTLFVSLEMTKDELCDRWLATALGMDHHKLSRGCMDDEDMDQMGSVFDRWQKIPLHVDDDSNPSLSNLRSKALRHKHEHGLDVLFIDYLQLIEAPSYARDNSTREMSVVSRKIKQLARELEVPVIALSQLNRAVENRPDRRPVMSDLRESGGIEQDVDQCLMLYRDDYYNDQSEQPGITDLYLRKNRVAAGVTGRAQVRFDKDKHQFFSVDWKHTDAPEDTEAEGDQ